MFCCVLFESFVVAIKVYNALVDNPNTELSGAPPSVQFSPVRLSAIVSCNFIARPALPPPLHSSSADLFGVKFSKTISKL